MAPPPPAHPPPPLSPPSNSESSSYSTRFLAAYGCLSHTLPGQTMEPVSSRPSNTLFHWTKWPPGKGRGGWCPGESRERGREAGETGTWRARSQIRTMFHLRFSDASLPLFSQGHTWSCVDGQNIGGRINTHTHTHRRSLQLTCGRATPLVFQP